MVRLLIACDELTVAGGIYRFERLGRAVRKLGHELAYVVFNTSPRHGFVSESSVLSFDEAASQQWDATFVPGGGFPDITIEAFSRLQAPAFGVRVQHILNDTTRSQQFEAVNRSFRPDTIIFNNRHWQPEHFSRFEAGAFHYLEGAVDTDQLSPSSRRGQSNRPPRYVLGGLAGKNAGPLIEAAYWAGADVALHLFGPAGELPSRARSLADQGRLRCFGVLKESELPAFYAGLDCVVHTEAFAGWANLAAEAMASGVPVICTPHGTAAFAEDGVTALVVPEPTPEALIAAIRRLMGDQALASRLAARARERVELFSWTSYAAELLRLIQPPAARFETWSPSLELFGKWPEEAQLAGLEWLLTGCAGKTVCDLGCDEGVIARRLLERGAAMVHGFERRPSRVALASRVCEACPGAQFWEADLSDWTCFEAAHAPHLSQSYDIVLYLGLHHHLPRETRLATLRGAARRAGAWLIVRMPNETYAGDRIAETLAQEGLWLVRATAGESEPRLGEVYAFHRGPAA